MTDNIFIDKDGIPVHNLDHIDKKIELMTVDGLIQESKRQKEAENFRNRKVEDFLLMVLGYGIGVFTTLLLFFLI